MGGLTHRGLGRFHDPNDSSIEEMRSVVQDSRFRSLIFFGLVFERGERRVSLGFLVERKRERRGEDENVRSEPVGSG